MQKVFLFFIGIVVSISILFYIDYKKFNGRINSLKVNIWPYNRIEYILTKSDPLTHLRVSIIDTGINKEDYCFKGFNVKNIDISQTVASENDLHGNFVMSIICNDDLFRKTEIKQIKFYSIDVGNDNNITVKNLISGIKKAIELKSDIINISLGTYDNNKELKAVIEEAIKKNIIIIAASGDDITEQSLYPASYDSVVSVACLDKNNEYMLSNNTNGKIVISAPGEKITTGIKNSKNKGFYKINGSSAAAAIVTNVVIRLKLFNSRITPQQLINILKVTSIDLGVKGKDKHYGYGLINYKNIYMYLKKPLIYKIFKIIEQIEI